MDMKLTDIIVSSVTLVALLAGEAAGQSRREVGIGGLRPVGWGPSARTESALQTYYTGMSDLNIRTLHAGGGVLASSVYTGGNMIVRPSSVATPDGAYAYRAPTPAGSSDVTRRYGPPSLSAPGVPQAGAVSSQPVPPTSALVDYLEVQKVRRDLIRKKVITSLVPATPGEYHDAMLAGEDAFRQGQYAQAAKHFESARRLSKDSPASLLSAARAALATATDSYAPTAQLLCLLLKKLPELPMVRIAPRTFYGKQGDLDQQVVKLANHVKKHPTDATAEFVVAYILWRSGSAAKANAALTVASSNAKDPALVAGIQALSKGIEMARKTAKQDLPELAEPHQYSHAGIRIALPVQYQLLPVVVRGQILNASRPDDGRNRVIITLDTRTVGKGVTAEGFWNYATSHWQQSGIADLKLIEQRDVQVGGVPAVARLLTYSSDGHDVAAVGACFIREIKRTEGEPIRVAYLLLLKGTAGRMTDMFPMVNAIAQSIYLSEIRRPVDMPIELGDTAARDPLGRYALRVPKGWSFAQTEQGPILGQLDLLLGGHASPLVKAVVTDVPDSTNAKACGLDVISFLRQQKGHKVSIVSQSAARVGGKNGYQFVLRTRIPLPPPASRSGQKEDVPKTTKFSEPFIQVVRLLGVPGEPGRREYLLIALDCYDTPAEKAEAVMDKVAGGVMLLGWRHRIKG